MQTDKPYSASTYWEFIRKIMKFFPRPGFGVDIKYLRAGIVLSVNYKVFWRHPWTHTFFWEIDPTYKKSEAGKLLGSWYADVHPGFCNGFDVHAYDEETKEYLPLINDPQPALKIGAWRNPIAPAGISATDDGISYAPGEGYPKWFETIGVMPASKGGSADSDPYDYSDPTRTRQLRAADTVLTVPRISTASEVTVSGDPTAERTVAINTTFNTQALNVENPYKIDSRPQLVSMTEPELLDRLNGTAVEPSIDQIRIATVYAVSPSNAALDAEPDESWTLYVQYDCFWNLSYASKGQFPEGDSSTLTFQTSIAGGIGNVLFAALLQPVNDAYEVIRQYFGGSDFSGKFWEV